MILIRWDATGTGIDTLTRRYRVQRHGTGRKYWEAHYPDGTHTDNFLSRDAARTSCALWMQDPTLVPLVDVPPSAPAEASRQTSTEVDRSSTRGQELLKAVQELLRQVDLTDAGDTRTARRRALATLEPLSLARRLLDELTRQQVTRARATTPGRSYYWDYGAPTWEEIGKALGVTKQAAQGRYGKTP